VAEGFVDPWLWNLDPADKERFRRYAADIRSAAAECLRIEDRDRHGRLVPFNFNCAQEELHLLWEKIRVVNLERSRGETDGPVRIVALKARQVGISTYVQGRFFLEAGWFPNLHVAVVAHLDDAAKNVLAKARLNWSEWATERHALRRDVMNFGKNEIAWPHHSWMSVKTARSKLGAHSYTHHRVHGSEYGLYEDYTGFSGLVDTVPDNGTIVLESTARGLGGPFHQTWTDALEFDEWIRALEERDSEKLGRWNGYIRFFFPWFKDAGRKVKLAAYERAHILETLDKDSDFEGEKDLLESYPEVTVEHLAWRRRRVKEYRSAPSKDGLDPLSKFHQEHPSCPEEAFVSSGKLVFNQASIREIWKVGQKTKPLFRCELKNDFAVIENSRSANLTVYEPPRPGRFYVIGADVAEGKDQDESVGMVFDRCDGSFLREVACWASGRIESQTFADVLCVLGDWYNEAFIIHENNGAAGSVVSFRLIQNQYHRVYRSEVLDRQSNEREPTSFSVGFRSSILRRPQFISASQIRILNRTIEIRTRACIEQHQAFAIQTSGKMDHPPGGKSDYVIAVGMAVHGDETQAPSITRATIRKIKSLSEEFEPVEPSHHKALMAKLRRSDVHNRKVLGRAFVPRV
jgi:hypothetical protein